MALKRVVYLASARSFTSSNFVTALVPSLTAYLASSPGRRSESLEKWWSTSQGERLRQRYTLENIIDEAVHGAHRLAQDPYIRMHLLLQHLVDEDRVALISLLPTTFPVTLRDILSCRLRRPRRHFLARTLSHLQRSKDTERMPRAGYRILLYTPDHESRRATASATRAATVARDWRGTAQVTPTGTALALGLARRGSLNGQLETATIAGGSSFHEFSSVEEVVQEETRDVRKRQGC